MKPHRLLFLGLLFSFLLLGTAWVPVGAQLGLGFGVGGWGGNGGGFGFFGAGIHMIPRMYNPGSTYSSKDTQKAKKGQIDNTPGVLDGYVKLCSLTTAMPTQMPAPPPVQGNTTGPAPAQIHPPAQAKPQPLAAPICRPTNDGMQNVVVLASPYGTKQWVAAKPDATGYYRMSLPPGGYLLQVNLPGYPQQQSREVIIQPGQTSRQNIQLGG